MKKTQSIFGQNYFKKQLDKFRNIRSSERRFYQQITDIYAGCSIDYDLVFTKEFFASVQNKLHLAITGQTSSEIILSRANHEKEKWV